MVVTRKRLRRVIRTSDSDDGNDNDGSAVNSLQPIEHPSESPSVARPSVQNSTHSHQSRAWDDMYSDSSNQNGLLISSRKAKDLKNWFSNALNAGGPRVLLLAGPPGCGKTSAIRSISTQLHCTLVKWQPPATAPTGVVSNLLDDLHSFLLSTRYASLALEHDDLNKSLHPSDLAKVSPSTRRVILIDDLPSTSYDLSCHRDALRCTLQQAAQFAAHPTVLLLSDSAKGIARTARLVLGLDFVNSPLVESINIPPVTDVMMRKRLQHVASHQGINVSRTTMDAIIASSAGDFRSALNYLQFSSNGITQNHPNQRGRRTVKRPRQTRPQSLVLAGQDVGADPTLGTYHAVSKILNNKRDSSGQSKYNPEDILQEARADPSNFLEFLHHNYASFFGESDDIVLALDCLSEADTMLRWRQEEDARTTLGDCAASMATRGFLLFNSSPIRSGWRPICGPESYEIRRNGWEHETLARERLCRVTAPQVFSNSDLYNMLPTVEFMSGNVLKPWGARSGQSPRASKIVDGADIAMIDIEEESPNHFAVGVVAPSENLNVSKSARTEASVTETLESEDIEEFDD